MNKEFIRHREKDECLLVTSRIGEIKTLIKKLFLGRNSTDEMITLA